MIKRFLSLVLCLCLLGAATVAFAAEVDTTGVVDLTNAKNTAEVDSGNFGTGYSVNITAVADDTAINVAPDVYSVEIVWGDMAFAYGYDATTDTAEWDPETHTYIVTEQNGTVTATKGWYLVNNTTTLSTAYAGYDLATMYNSEVAVFNHSTLPVDATIEITNLTDGDTDDITAEFTASTDTVAATEGVYELPAAILNDVYHNETSVIGTVSMTKNMETFDAYTDPVEVATLTVTISEHE